MLRSPVMSSSGEAPTDQRRADSMEQQKRGPDLNLLVQKEEQGSILTKSTIQARGTTSDSGSLRSPVESGRRAFLSGTSHRATNTKGIEPVTIDLMGLLGSCPGGLPGSFASCPY